MDKINRIRNTEYSDIFHDVEDIQAVSIACPGEIRCASAKLPSDNIP